MAANATQMTNVGVKDLRIFVNHILQKLGVNQFDAGIVTEGLIRANLEGLDSHGVSRLPVYAARLVDGRINNSPNITIQRNAPSALMVDGDNGLGHAVAYRGVQEGMRVAKEQGLACVAIKSSNHFGAASYYCQLAGEEDMITFACTNSPPAIAPWGGTEPFFGTNPIAFGFPSKEGPPVIADMSTSVVARGKIMLAAKNGEVIPDGWALDRFGNMTNDPREALQGTLLPAGGAKGAALALSVEILAGVLTGAAISRDVKSIYNEQLSGGAGVGHFFIFISTETYNYAHSYEKKLKHMLQLMKDVPGHNNREVRYPGERRQSDSEKHLQKGIDLPDSVFKELTLLGNQLGVTFPQKTADGWLINPEFEIKGSGKNPT